MEMSGNFEWTQMCQLCTAIQNCFFLYSAWNFYVIDSITFLQPLTNVSKYPCNSLETRAKSSWITQLPQEGQWSTFWQILLRGTIFLWCKDIVVGQLTITMHCNLPQFIWVKEGNNTAGGQWSLTVFWRCCCVTTCQKCTATLTLKILWKWQWWPNEQIESNWLSSTYRFMN